MDRNLEQNFKDAFEQYELPYNPAAWDALNKKLDQNETVNTKKRGGNRLNWIIGAFVILGGLTTLFLINKGNTDSPSEVVNATNKINEDQTIGKVKENTVSSAASANNAINSPEKLANPESHLDKSELPSSSSIEKVNTTGSKGGNGVIPNVNIEPENGISQQENPLKNEIINNVFNLPVLAQNLCQSTEKTIENPNKSDLLITDPRGNKTFIQPNASKKINFNQTGEYTFQSAVNPAIKSMVTVKESPQVDFYVTDQLIYENGIPTTVILAADKATKYEWKVNNAVTNQGKQEFVGHFYKRGTYAIELTQTNQYGCKATTSKDVQIDESYNLLAPSGFMPLSSDSRKNKFIPFALTVRNTDFRMIIIEPRSGNVIFETTSIDGWDGIDPTTKQLVQENNSYVWKVVLSNPEMGESREYSGIVTRL